MFEVTVRKRKPDKLFIHALVDAGQRSDDEAAVPGQEHTANGARDLHLRGMWRWTIQVVEVDESMSITQDESVLRVFANGIDGLTATALRQSDLAKLGARPLKEAVVRTYPKTSSGVLEDGPNVRVAQTVSSIEDVNAVCDDVEETSTFRSHPKRLIVFPEESRQIAGRELAHLRIAERFAVGSVEETEAAGRTDEENTVRFQREALYRHLRQTVARAPGGDIERFTLAVADARHQQ
jgi:hypothetical protein